MTVSPSQELKMKDLTEKQFCRLTQVQKIEIVIEAFNRRSQDNLDAYEAHRQEEESDEEARIVGVQHPSGGNPLCVDSSIQGWNAGAGSPWSLARMAATSQSSR